MLNSDWLTPANHPTLLSGEAHIWAVRLNPAVAPLDLLATILSSDERRRADDFRLAAPRQQFIVARAALRILLARYLETASNRVVITADANNKPRLADDHAASDLRFNVAHSATLGLIAVTTGREIGVDIERLREVRHAEHIAWKYFHPAEIAAIAAAPPAARHAAFLRCWTGKEAVLKAVGAGITGSLAAFHIPSSVDGESGLSTKIPMQSPPRLTQCWLRRIDPDDNYLAAVAVVGPRLIVRRMAFKS